MKIRKFTFGLLAVLFVVLVLFSSCEEEMTHEEIERKTSSIVNEIQQNNERDNPSPNLRVHNVNFDKDDDCVTIDGRITNNSKTTTYKYVELKVTYKDSMGRAVCTDYIHADLYIEGIAPNETSSFDTIKTNAKDIYSAEVSFYDCE